MMFFITVLSPTLLISLCLAMGAKYFSTLFYVSSYTLASGFMPTISACVRAMSNILSDIKSTFYILIHCNCLI